MYCRKIPLPLLSIFMTQERGVEHIYQKQTQQLENNLLSVTLVITG